VVLGFDEAVATVPGSVRVFDSEVERVDSGDVRKPSSDSVSVGLRSGLPRGTYVVAWRVISADSHPVRGAFAFSVGEPLGETSDVVQAVLDQDADSQSVDVALWVIRLVGLALILLCVGAAVILTFVADRSDLDGRWHWWCLAIVGVLLVIDSLAWIALTGVKAAGFGLSDIFRWSVSREVVDTTFGKVWALRALLGLAISIVAVLALLGRIVHTGALVALAAAIAVTPALSGHARIEGTFAVVCDVVHVLAAGVWAGGLAFLALLLVEAGGDRWSLATRTVPRFSTLALGAVVALVAAGIASGYLEVRSWSGLWETTYGRLLLAKVALLVPLLLLGVFNNRRSVPRLRAGAIGQAGRRAFVRSVATELALMVAVVGVTAALVAEPPAKAAAVASAVVTRDGKVGPYDYSLTVDPAHAGSNQVHIYVLALNGQPAAVDEITVAARLPSADVGPLDLRLTPAGPGHVTGVSELPLPGTWSFRLGVRRGEFDEWSTVIDIPIRKDS
jgi:copper transport protein